MKTSMMKEEELKVGIITKRSQMKKSYGPVNFKSRVFVLTCDKIVYYEGSVEQRGKLKGSINLDSISYVGAIPDHALKRTNAFQIKHSNYYLYCFAQSVSERDDWIQAIKNACSPNHHLLMRATYHPGVFSGNKWQCCKRSSKHDEGCNSNDDFLSELAQRKSIPNIPYSTSPMQPCASADQKVVVAIFHYEPAGNGAISLHVGERCTLLNNNHPDWCFVRNRYGAEGYVPRNYIRHESSDGVESESWFQGDLSRQRAEYLLKQDGKEGSFVVRNSSQPAVVYTLSILSKAGRVSGPTVVKHYHIKTNDQGYVYLSADHPKATVTELINYHKHDAGGMITRLRNAPSSLQTAQQSTAHVFSDSKWEIDLNEIEMLHVLGSGQFGVVKLARVRGSKYVAVKIMKEGTMEEDSFIEEAQVMTQLKHPNLVELYGVVTKQRPLCIVTEYMEGGCLLDYIREHPQLQTQRDMILDMCYQICDAMKYLESKNMIHRDLAARNCLVGKNMLIKVADFGLARYVLGDEYTSSLGSKFPIKWSAPEVLYYTKFSSKSDVWAYGVIMWELFSGGLMPFSSLNNFEVVEQVSDGLRLEKPSGCPVEVYDVMMRTWEYEPEDRPSFQHLLLIVEELFDVVNANFHPEGTHA